MATKSNPVPVLIVIIAAIAILVGVAIVFGGDDGGTTVEGGITAFADVSVSGGSLPRFDEGPDGAIGLTAPQVTGVDFDGTPVSIEDNGRAKLILFLAHW